MLYEKTSKAWKWWIEQQCPSKYKWVPKTKTKWVPKVRNENVKKKVSVASYNTNDSASTLGKETHNPKTVICANSSSLSAGTSMASEQHLLQVALPSPPLPLLPLPSPPLPPLPASLFIPPPVNHREDTPKAELPPRKRLCLTAPISRFEVGESSTATARPTRGHRADYGFIGTLDAKIRCQRAEKVSYGIRDVWVDPAEAVKEVAPTTLEGVNDRVTELARVQEEDTQDIYAVIEDVQDRQTLLSQRVDVLVEDKEFHQETVLLMEQEALVSQDAWAQLVGLSSAVHQELQVYRTHTQIQDHRIASQEALTATLVARISFL
ncbi:hypothetical protein Tco_0906626 [Tanacetum coccineum]|uniref:Uncharacterized protein n=1 Tax=Tanacetum coccineum TaxID=301880 RepID=A0ABQ5CGZ8_9ASTR